MQIKRLKIFQLLVFFSVFVNAQQNNTLFFMHDVPQSNIVNPAIPIDCNLFVAAPIVGSTHVNLFNTALTINDFFKSELNDSVTLDFDNAVGKLNGIDVFSQENHVSLFSAGYRLDDVYYTFSVTEKVTTHSIVPKNPVLLLWKGNTQFIGDNVDISGMHLNFTHLREYAFGISKSFSNDFRFGGRMKVLFGKSNVYTKRAGAHFYTDERAFESNLDLNLMVNSSLPIDVEVNSAGIVDNIEVQDDFSTVAYMLNRNNMGVGVDLGFLYAVNENVEISGSLLNVGFIRWKSDVNNFPSEGSLDFVGSGNTNDVNSEGVISEWVDTVLSVFGVRPTQNSYYAPLVSEIYLGSTFVMNDWINAGVLFHSQIYKNRLHPSLTLSGNANLTPYLAASVSYTLQNREFNNVGAGISLSLGGIQIHAMSDNIPGLIMLENTRNINLRFGISMLLGCSKVRTKDCECVGDPYGEYRSNIRPGRR